MSSPKGLEAVLQTIELARSVGESVPDGRVVVPRPPRLDPADVSQVDMQDLRARVEAVLMSRRPDVALELLEASGILAAFLPEVMELVGFGDGEWRHKDVWKHTKQVVLQARPTPTLRWAALFHDIGKPRTRRICPDGQVHFLGHAEVGASMFDRIAARVPFGGEERDRVRFLILHHLRANQYEASWTDSAIRRFAREMGDCLPELLALSEADITTKRPERKARGTRAIAELAERIEQLRAEDSRLPPLPKGIGELIIAHLGIRPGPQVGEIKRKLEQAVEDGKLEARREPEYYLPYLSQVTVEAEDQRQ